MIGPDGVHIRDLHKRFGERRVFDGFSLSAEPGEFVALLGPSGAGKTTLLRCVARLADPDAGEIIAAGHPMHRLHGRALRAARRDIGFVFQQFNLVRRRSAIVNVLAGRLAAVPLWRVVLGHYAEDDRKAAYAALERVGLLDHAAQRADQLSGGQQQRVAIARAVVQKSRILLADEPVASLDPESAEGVLTLLRDIVREHRMTVLCSLHQPLLAGRFADTTCLLQVPAEPDSDGERLVVPGTAGIAAPPIVGRVP
jgi:phosphonate transport system ATP-binding protein